MSNDIMKARAEQFGMGSFFDDLIKKVGPVLGGLILDFLTSKAHPAVTAKFQAVANDQAQANAFDVKHLLSMLLSKFGQQIIDGLVAQLDANTDPLSKFLSTVVKTGGTELLKAIVAMLDAPISTPAFVNASTASA